MCGTTQIFKALSFLDNYKYNLVFADVSKLHICEQGLDISDVGNFKRK